jgi:hypothetical protein
MSAFSTMPDSNPAQLLKTAPVVAKLSRMYAHA